MNFNDTHPLRHLEDDTAWKTYRLDDQTVTVVAKETDFGFDVYMCEGAEPNVGLAITTTNLENVFQADLEGAMDALAEDFLREEARKKNNYEAQSGR